MQVDAVHRDEVRLKAVYRVVMLVAKSMWAAVSARLKCFHVRFDMFL